MQRPAFIKLIQYCLERMSYKKKVARMFDVDKAQVADLYKEILHSAFYRDIINKAGVKNGFFDFNMSMVLRAPTLYVICRIMKPEIVVETGVADGFSSAFILKALESNKKGRLFSIDLPNEPGHELVKGRSTGWLVPDILKDRWSLTFGSSKVKLPLLLKELKKIDIFYHDSDHSYNNMYFEMTEASGFLEEAGVIICDDTTDNAAFSDFSKSNGLISHQLFKFGIIFDSH